MIQHVVVTVGCATWAAVGQIPLSTLLAQADVPPITGSQDLFWRFANTIGALGILAWYFYQTQTKTIPDKDAQIAAERVLSDAKVKAAIEASNTQIQATLTATTSQLQEERLAHSRSLERIVDELKEEREARMQIILHCGFGPSKNEGAK